MTSALRPLSTGELLDRTFSLYRSHFGLFIGIFALPHLVVLAFQCLGVAVRSPGNQLSAVLTLFAWSMGALLLTMIVSATSHAATVVAVSEVHLDRPASVMDSFLRVKGQILGVIGLSLLVGLLVGLAFLALIVPGVLLAIQWSLAVPAKVLENKSVTDAMSRSTDLTKGNRGRIFVIWVLFFVLSIGVSLLMRWPVEALAGVSSVGALQRSSGAWQVALLVSTFIAECLVGPLATIALSLVYFDERVRKEAFDLQLMMSTLDTPALPVSPVQAGA
jgi:Membrane domain of glycerophosphoryl diester phosphodiesterase